MPADGARRHRTENTGGRRETRRAPQARAIPLDHPVKLPGTQHEMGEFRGADRRRGGVEGANRGDIVHHILPVSRAAEAAGSRARYRRSDAIVNEVLAFTFKGNPAVGDDELRMRVDRLVRRRCARTCFALPGMTVIPAPGGILNVAMSGERLGQHLLGRLAGPGPTATVSRCAARRART